MTETAALRRDRKPHVLVNLLFLRPGQMTGPGVYAYSLMEELLKDDRLKFTIITQGAGVRPEFAIGSEFFKELPPLGGRGKRVAFEQLRLPRLADELGCDIIFSPGFVSPLWGRQKKAVMIHDLYFRVCPQFLEAKQRLYWRFFIPISIWVSDLIFTNSQNTHKDLEYYYPSAKNKSCLTLLGCRFAANWEAQSATAGHKGFILFVASVTENKNVGTLLDAAVLLREQGRAISNCAYRR